MSCYSTAKQGKYAGGKIPYGYILDGDKFIVSEDGAKNVVKIFKMYSEGKSYEYIANYLNSTQKYDTDDLDSSGDDCVNYKKWSRTSICYILRNLTYTGLYIYDGKKEQNNIKVNMIVPALISKQLFNKVQEMRNKKSKCK